MLGDYLRTDEKEDLISSLKLVRLSAAQSKSDEQFWKWTLIGTHSSLQAAIVFHLSFGNDFLVAKPNHVKKWLTAHRDEGRAYPDMHMDFFLDLYRKAKSEEVLGYRLSTTESQDSSVKRLAEFRNDFIHFMPKGWSIELAGLPSLCIDSLEVIAALARGPFEVRCEDDSQKSRFEEVLTDSLEQLRILDLAYDA